MSHVSESSWATAVVYPSPFSKPSGQAVEVVRGTARRRWRRWRLAVGRYGLPVVVAAAVHTGIFLFPPGRRPAPPRSDSATNTERLTVIELQPMDSWAPLTDSLLAEASPAASPRAETAPAASPGFTAPVSTENPAWQVLAVGSGHGAAATSFPSMDLVGWNCSGLDRASDIYPEDGRSFATFAPEPYYPERARQEARQGTVELKVLAGPDGKPRQVEIVHSSRSSDLDEAARAVVLGHWQFRKQQELRSYLVQVHFELSGTITHRGEEWSPPRKRNG